MLDVAAGEDAAVFSDELEAVPTRKGAVAGTIHFSWYDYICIYIYMTSQSMD